jgi:hypothetical protein
LFKLFPQLRFERFPLLKSTVPWQWMQSPVLFKLFPQLMIERFPPTESYSVMAMVKSPVLFKMLERFPPPVRYSAVEMNVQLPALFKLFPQLMFEVSHTQDKVQYSVMTINTITCIVQAVFTADVRKVPTARSDQLIQCFGKGILLI